MRSAALQVVIGVITSSVAMAQTARPATDAQILSRGWGALAAGRLAEAISTADSLLKRKPRSHSALGLKIEALSRGTQPLSALDAYEAWIPKAGHNVDDRGLLEPIAAGLLRVLSTDRNPVITTTALEFLAKSGDDDAIEALRKRSAAGEPGATVALVERGDAGAVQTLQTFVDSSIGRDISTAIRTLAAHQGLTPALIQKLATDRVPMNRAAIAEAMVQSTDPQATQLLETLSREADPLVRRSVALARAKSGDQAALTQARAMLTSEVADIRLIAAEALQSSMPAEVEQAVRPLLTNRDGNYRFRAAAIVGKTDPAAVQSVLAEGLADANPVIQQEAARVVASALSGDIVVLRQLLRHRDPFVVANAAGAILLQ